MKTKVKTYYFRFRVFLIAFAVGLASFSLLINFEIFKNDRQYENNVIVLEIPKSPRFTAGVLACGTGYIQNYESQDGQQLTEGSIGCDKPKFGDKQIVQRNLESIISKIEINNKSIYKIYQLENGNGIEATTIKLGLELERYLKKQSLMKT